MSKATITIEDAGDGHVKAQVIFDPPLPEGEHNDEWLDSIPHTQAVAILLMDHLMDRLEGNYQVSVIEGEGHGQRH